MVSDNYKLINWKEYIKNKIPSFLQKNFLISWLLVLISPIIWLHNEFIKYKNQALYKASHSSQIASLQAVLNDNFDNSKRRIKIINITYKESIYFYEPQENKEVFFYKPEENKPNYFYEIEDLNTKGIDFLVLIPKDIISNNKTEQIRAQVDYYKLYSKNYELIEN